MFYRYFVAIIISVIALSASDTITVQTLTFEDIYKRRGTWTFPDNPNEFRKILMSYRLKCDPKTPHDKYNCGEWDYLTYTTVYKKTGEIDSNEAEHPLYKIGRLSPDTIRYSTTPISYKRKFRYTELIPDSLVNPSTLIWNNIPDSVISLKNKKNRIQFIIDKNTLNNSAIDNKINQITFFTKNSTDFEIEKLTLKYGYTSDDFPLNISDINMEKVYEFFPEISNDSLLIINLNEPIELNPFRSILFDLSVDLKKDNQLILYAGDGKSNILNGIDYNQNNDLYVKFDGDYDYVETEINDELNDVSEFTMEGWFYINEWKNWAHIFGKGGRTGLELGNREGDLYCLIRKEGNSYGKATYAIQTNKWTHIAMVYNGNADNESEKLKLYINGKEKGLDFSSAIPEKTEENDIPFSISSLRSASSAFNGMADNIRVWKNALDKEIINQYMFDNELFEHPNKEYLLSNITFNSKFQDYLMIENEYNCKFFGLPEIISKESEYLSFNPELINLSPKLKLIETDETTYTTNEKIIEKYFDLPPVSVLEYEIENYKPIIKKHNLVWLAGYVYDYDENGEISDSTYYDANMEFINDTLRYYQKPYEKVLPYEIGRFITPYGINLDLGPEGFEWMYDVTDYAPLLTGEVELSAGNLQELIDLKFYFIKGTPAREVIEITQVWGPRRSYSYEALDNDNVLKNKEIELNPEASQFKVVTRLTGHGHRSNTGDPPHCCEWKENTHYLYVNGEEAAQWNIFRHSECAQNPVFPQGGTWPGAREGWCPGDLVEDYNFEITDLIDGNKVSLDYDITDVPEDNQGMGKGNYVVAMQLIQYGESNNSLDAEIYDVISPNSWEYYSRVNPICSNPQIILRNNGTEVIESVNIKYNVSGGEEYTYLWETLLLPNEKSTLDLPMNDSWFWLGDGSNEFKAEIISVNGKNDDYSDNNIYMTKFEKPDLYEKNIVIVYKTNSRPQYYSYGVFDIENNLISEKNNLNANSIYRDTISVNSNGCYTFMLIDQAQMGLSYWAYPSQGNGYVRIEDLNGKVLKSFNPDFGYGINYSFNIGDVTSVDDYQHEYLVELYPNPADNEVKIYSTKNLGNMNISIYNLLGEKIYSTSKILNENSEFFINVSDFPTGDYFIHFENEIYHFTKRFIKK